VKAPKILVVGDLMVDHYLWGSCERISPEAPVQVVDVKKETKRLGGAGNVINNLIDLGCEVGICSVVGDDEGGEFLDERLSSRGVKKEVFLVSKERQTSVKSRVIASHQQIIRVDKETKQDISSEIEKEILSIYKEVVENYDGVVLSDYAKGVLTSSLTSKLIDIANKNGKVILADPKGNDYSKYSGATLLTPNKKEASQATSIDIKDKKTLTQALEKLKNELSLDFSLITLSEDGIALLEKQFHQIPTVAQEVFDVTGAGDTVIASLAFGLCSGLDILETVKFANYAAAVVVAKVGSATATLEEIEEYKASIHKGNIQRNLKTLEQIKKQVLKLKQMGKKIVFTNGCFDILHRGHVSYLDTAKSFGDILVLGLNSDSSVKKLKGENRPINNEEDRAFVLLALESVDFVTIFNKETPYDLIKALEPDVLVKGGDYEGKEVVGSDIVKEVKLVQFVDGKSTTKTIEKIKSS
jgi:D-beta-D-heptose 7-phosphate kinase/D-beta-D-heptose 1-phosphate adenosyltransferase